MNLYTQPSTHLNTLLGLLKGLKVQPKNNGQSILDSPLQEDSNQVFTRATVAEPEGMRKAAQCVFCAGGRAAAPLICF